MALPSWVVPLVENICILALIVAVAGKNFRSIRAFGRESLIMFEWENFGKFTDNRQICHYLQNFALYSTDWLPTEDHDRLVICINKIKITSIRITGQAYEIKATLQNPQQFQGHQYMHSMQVYAHFMTSRNQVHYSNLLYLWICLHVFYWRH